MSTAIRWSGAALALGAIGLGVSMALLAARPIVNQALEPGLAALLLASSTVLLLALPAMYGAQADRSGPLGLLAHVLLSAGLLLLVLVAGLPLADSGFAGPYAENAVFFVLGIALTAGLLLTGVSTLRARVFPRGAGALMVAATLGFFFAFFVAEDLPAGFLALGTGLFAALLALGFAWVGVALWGRSSA